MNMVGSRMEGKASLGAIGHDMRVLERDGEGHVFL
jgi:hypothetical protein